MTQWFKINKCLFDIIVNTSPNGIKRATLYRISSCLCGYRQNTTYVFLLKSIPNAFASVRTDSRDHKLK